MSQLKLLQDLPNKPIGKLFNTIRYFHGYTINPVSLLFYLTYRCNLTCGFCLQTDQRAALVKNYPDMSLEQVKKLTDEVKTFFPVKPIIHLFGGEPMMYPHFDEYIQYLGKTGVGFSITTNGWNLDKKAEFLVKNGMTAMNVSLDAVEDVHDKGRGLKGTYQEAVKGIAAVKAAREALGKKAPEININMVINETNHRILKKSVDDLQKTGTDFITLQHLIFTRAEMNDIEKMDANVIYDELQAIKAADYEKPVIFYPGIRDEDIKGYYTSLDYPFGRKCLRPWFGPTIMPNGDVVLCPASGTTGNVTKNTLAEIWNNTANRTFRNSVQKNGITHPHCWRCCHRQYY